MPVVGGARKAVQLERRDSVHDIGGPSAVPRLQIYSYPLAMDLPRARLQRKSTDLKKNTVPVGVWRSTSSRIDGWACACAEASESPLCTLAPFVLLDRCQARQYPQSTHTAGLSHGINVNV